MTDNFHFIEEIDPTVKVEAEKLLPALNAAFYSWVLVDKHARIVGANDDYIEFISREFSAVANKKMVEINPATHLPDVIKTGEPDVLYLLTWNRTHCVASSVPLFNEAKEVIGAIGIVVFKDADIARLRPLLDAMVRLRKRQEEKSPARYTFEDIEGNSQALEEAKILAKRAAHRDSAILLAGETGTGKEIFAHAIHAARNRPYAPFVPVNTAGIPRERLEEELFGVAPIADTDRQGRKGKLDLAHNGTLFLDEIGELPVPAQALLLRVLEEKAVAKIGVNQRASINVRIISATSRDLRAMVMDGRFLAELYFRLNGVTITLPPLRKRLGDMKALCKVLLQDIANRWGEKRCRIMDPEFIRALCQYQWPGNVRELRHVLEQVCMRHDKHILTAEELAGIIPPDGPRLKERPVRPLRVAVQDCERTEITRALIATKGNNTEAAELLCITPKTLRTKRKALGITER